MKKKIFIFILILFPLLSYSQSIFFKDYFITVPFENDPPSYKEIISRNDKTYLIEFINECHEINFYYYSEHAHTKVNYDLIIDLEKLVPAITLFDKNSFSRFIKENSNFTFFRRNENINFREYTVILRKDDTYLHADFSIAVSSPRIFGKNIHGYLYNN